jgi:hypothetical protein
MIDGVFFLVLGSSELFIKNIVIDRMATFHQSKVFQIENSLRNIKIKNISVISSYFSENSDLLSIENISSLNIDQFVCLNTNALGISIKLFLL